MRRILFVGTRFGGTDGVSLETSKADNVFSQLGFETFYISAVLPNYPSQGKIIDTFHFNHPQIYKNHYDFVKLKTLDIIDVFRIASNIKISILKYIDEIKPDYISVQNASSIPMNIPLAVAIKEVLELTHIPAYMHNHDYYWERERYLNTNYDEFLSQYFPPYLDNIVQCSINTIAQNQLYSRKRIKSIIMPNVFDFNSNLNQLDEYSSLFKKDFNIGQNKKVIIQPTRLVRRKGIERTIELISKLEQKNNIILILTGYSGDEVDNYDEEIKQLIIQNNIDARFIGNRISDRRIISNNNRVYTLWDAFINADFCTIPSDIEGFCNHFTEACYFRKPIFINEYPDFVTDIKPNNFDVVSIQNGIVTTEAVNKVNEILKNNNMYQTIVDNNYELANKLYSYDILHENINEIFFQLNSNPIIQSNSEIINSAFTFS